MKWVIILIIVLGVAAAIAVVNEPGDLTPQSPSRSTPAPVAAQAEASASDSSLTALLVFAVLLVGAIWIIAHFRVGGGVNPKQGATQLPAVRHLPFWLRHDGSR